MLILKNKLCCCLQKLETADEIRLKGKIKTEVFLSYSFLLLALWTGSLNGLQVVKRFRPPPPLPVESIFAYSCVFDNPEDEDEYAVEARQDWLHQAGFVFCSRQKDLKTARIEAISGWLLSEREEGRLNKEN